MSRAPTDSLPVIDNRYRVTRVLGEGGMGIVYEAEHTGTLRPCAVKVIHGHIAKKGAALDRFLREGRAAGTIRSPHVIDVNDVGLDREGNAFMAMELLSGEDLGKLIEERGRISPQLALRIAAQALLGLSKAHTAGVVHRDIKPSNLFLARRPDNPLASGAVWLDGQRVVKVLDFGIAKLRAGEDEKGNLTKTGGLLGSPSYMSPEQSAGLPDIDHRTDIWSLGAVLYEALTGTTPYHGAQNLHQLMMALALGPPELITKRASDVPADLAAIVTKALAHDPAHRYQSAEEMLADVGRRIVGPEAITEEMLPVSLAAMVASAGTAGVVPVGLSSGGTPASIPARGETQPLTAAPQVALPHGITQAGLGRTVEPGQTRRLALLAAAIIAATIILAVVVVSLLPKRGASTAARADASSEAGAQVSPAQTASSAEAATSSGAPGSPSRATADDGTSDAGAPDAGGTGLGGAVAPGPGKAPAGAVSAPGGKTKPNFGGGRKL